MDKEINKIITKLEGCFGIFDYVLTPIESNLLVSYIKELQQENEKQKELIDRAIKHVSSLSSKGRGCMIYADVKKDILDILKGSD